MTTSRRERGSTTAAVLGVVAAFLGLVTAVLGLVPSLRPWQADGGSTTAVTRSDVTLPTSDPGDLRTPASVYLSKESGPGGASVKVSGENYAPRERVEIRFGAEVVGRPTTNEQGKFSNVAVEVPTSLSRFAPFQVEVVATGKTSIKWATAPFQVTG
jgi:hypothetical protein